MVVDLVFGMQGGELVIPDWLPAYCLGDLARAMGIETVVTGLPAWEKLHESMRDGLHSDCVRLMSVNELKEHLENV